MAAAAKTAATTKPDVYVPDPTTNLILTSIFLAEVLGALLSLSTGEHQLRICAHVSKPAHWRHKALSTAVCADCGRRCDCTWLPAP